MLSINILPIKLLNEVHLSICYAIQYVNVYACICSSISVCVYTEMNYLESYIMDANILWKPVCSIAVTSIISLVRCMQSDVCNIFLVLASPWEAKPNKYCCVCIL